MELDLVLEMLREHGVTLTMFYNSEKSRYCMHLASSNKDIPPVVTELPESSYKTHGSDFIAWVIRTRTMDLIELEK